MAFASVEEIDRHYTDAINVAGSPAAIIELKAEQKAVLTEFRLQQVVDRERKVWVREAVHDYPLAKSFPQLINGETEEEIRESAKNLHEQLTEAFQEHQRNQEMRRLYEASKKIGIDSEQVLRSGWKPPDGDTE